MNSRRIALWAAVAAAISWTAKAVAIGLAGGLDKSPAEGPLFLTGLGFFVVAVVALGVAATRGSRTWVRLLAGVGAFVAGLAASLLVDAAVGAFHASGTERHWVWSELNLWVAAVSALALAVASNRSRRPAGRTA